MKLKEYLKIENKIERLTKFIDDQGEWQNDYIENNEDFINNYFDLIEIGTIYLDNCDDEIKDLLQNEINKNKSIDFLFDNDLISCELTQGIFCRDNELWSYNLGEIELQLSGLSDHDNKIGCIYSELIKDMTENEIDEAINDSEFYCSDEYLYIDRSHDRVSFILKESEFLNYINQQQK